LKFTFKPASGKNEYEEVLSAKTDRFGMVNLVIGNGVKVGGTATSFEEIVWSSQARFLDVSIDKKGVYMEQILPALIYQGAPKIK
jgi:hypothetical protein